MPLVCFLLGLVPASPPAEALKLADEDIQAFLLRYDRLACELYSEAEAEALRLREVALDFLEEPTPGGLALARTAWVEARRVYGRTEALRFAQGPIDAGSPDLETWINAWPVDELGIDSGRPSAGGTVLGIIQDEGRYPELGADLLLQLHQRGGEVHVTLGWHAIEYLLWGQDLRAEGPGERPAEDFQIGAGAHAARRGLYLDLALQLLCVHLGEVRRGWEALRDRQGAEGASSVGRTRSRERVRRILVGLSIFSAFELCGERLAVGYETRDQEEEHSCFSDTTCNDLVENARGLELVLQGSGEQPRGADLLGLCASAAPAEAKELAQRLKAVKGALQRIPIPFDQALIAPEDSAPRRALLDAIEALESFSGTLGRLGWKLGWTLPVAPS